MEARNECAENERRIGEMEKWWKNNVNLFNGFLIIFMILLMSAEWLQLLLPIVVHHFGSLSHAFSSKSK